LTADQRQVIVLRFLEDLDLETAAAVMKKTIGAIKALQHRALTNLKKLLASEVQDAQVSRE
jgi:RNA polymerase sigma-70 factor (ECF subfamily)